MVRLNYDKFPQTVSEDRERSKNTALFLDQLYRNKFGREPDKAGKDYWYNQLMSGAMDQEGVAKAFDASSEGQNRLKSNDREIVNIGQVKQKIEDGGSNNQEQEVGVLPTYNAGAQTERNRQSQMNQMLQQHGKVLLDPAGGAVMGAGLGLALGDGKLQNALIGGGLGYLLARSNTINLPGGNKSFDASQAVEGTQPINGGEIQPAPELPRDEITSQSEAVYEKKADISGIDPEKGGLEIAPSLTDASTNRANAFADPVTLLAQSVKTTTENDFDPAFNSNMQPQVGGESGLELPAPGGQPGNVPNPADELVTSFTKGRVPNYVFTTLGGSVA